MQLPAHRPLPLHAVRLPAGCPLRRLLQVPTELDRLHDWHWPAQRTLQQTPSVQKPSSQSAPARHMEPTLSLPQLPPRQGWPSQSGFPPQVRAHWVSPALQRNGAQDRGVTTLHVPIPSQRDSVSVFEAASQVAGLQTAPSAYTWQAPLPSQSPVCLHVATASVAQAARPAGAGAPAATSTQ